MNNITDSSTTLKSTDVRMGFGLTLPTRSERQNLSVEIYGIIANWTKKQVLTAMGVLNAYLYEIQSESPCSNCRYWLGYYWFGIPMLCELKHQGHDWSKLPWCEYFDESK